MDEAADASNLIGLKRRRGPGYVTPNACTECRKKRSKCNGQNPCGRCLDRGVECAFEIPLRHSKGQMRSEIEQLKLKETQLKILINMLISDDDSGFFQEQLRKGGSTVLAAEDLDKVISNLKNPGAGLNTSQTNNTPNTATKSIIEVGLPVSISGCGDVLGTIHGVYKKSTLKNRQPWNRNRASLSKMHGGKIKEKSNEDQLDLQGLNRQCSIYDANWTLVTSDKALINHILLLYLCWEYPIFSPLSKDHFLEDFKTGNTEYCSSLLVNSILAVGSRYSDQPEVRRDPFDANTAGNNFFIEAIRILELEKDRCRITTIQAIHFLAIWEASCGRLTASLFYSDQSIGLAIEMGLHKDIDLRYSRNSGTIEQTVRLATFWGCFSLDQAWSIIIGRVPQFSEAKKSLRGPTHTKSENNLPWIPYIEDGTQVCEVKFLEPSSRWDVFSSVCKLSEIIHKSSHVLYSPSNMVTSSKLLACYTDYLRWYDTTPIISRYGHDFTPAALFSHIYYHAAILLLFRPFIKLEIVDSAVSPSILCSQASEAISNLLVSYSKLYTLRRVPIIVPYLALTSIIAQLVIYQHSGTGLSNLKQGFASLREMAASHGFATFGLHIFIYLSKLWGVKVDLHTDKNSENEKNSSKSSTYDRMIHEKICLAVSTNVNQFCPHITVIDTVDDSSPISFEKNPIFLPLLLQGRPSVDAGYEKIERLGFRAIDPGSVHVTSGD